MFVCGDGAEQQHAGDAGGRKSHLALSSPRRRRNLAPVRQKIFLVFSFFLLFSLRYEGAPLRLVLLFADGTTGEKILSCGSRQTVVAAGTWMAAHSLGSFSAFGCCCAPPWEARHFEGGGRAELTEKYPAAREDIRRFCTHE
jgi:hypothetical protein